MSIPSIGRFTVDPTGIFSEKIVKVAVNYILMLHRNIYFHNLSFHSHLHLSPPPRIRIKRGLYNIFLQPSCSVPKFKNRGGGRGPGFAYPPRHPGMYVSHYLHVSSPPGVRVNNGSSNLPHLFSCRDPKRIADMKNTPHKWKIKGKLRKSFILHFT